MDSFAAYALFGAPAAGLLAAYIRAFKQHEVLRQFDQGLADQVQTVRYVFNQSRNENREND